MSKNSFGPARRGGYVAGPAFLLCALIWCSIAVLAPPRSHAQSAAARVVAPGAAGPRAEIRAFWVDAFNRGIRTPQEADQLVADAKRAGVNTLIVQVRRRGDALYLKGVEPPLDDPAYDPSFDALANIIDVAHKAGLEVHAWINAMPVWRDQPPPRDARHAFNRHGPLRRVTTAGSPLRPPVN